MWVFRGPSQRFHPVGQSSPPPSLSSCHGVEANKRLVPNLLEKNPGILVENGITGGVWEEELRLESEKATKLADTLGWTCWDCDYFTCLRYSGVTFCVNRVFFMFPISSSLCPEHRQRFPSLYFETCFKKKWNRRLSFFHNYHSYLILKSYPQIESTSMFVWNWGTNMHQKNPLKELFARMFVCSPRHDFSVPGWWGFHAECRDHQRTWCKAKRWSTTFAQGGWLAVDVELEKRCKATDCDSTKPWEVDL